MRVFRFLAPTVTSNWRHVIADIETDGLLDTLTKVHCLVLRDLDTGEVMSCTDSAPREWYTSGWRYFMDTGLAALENAERIYFHNGIEFDVPALRKVYPALTLPESKVRDSLVIARLRWAHIKDSDWDRVRKGRLPGKLLGRHSLEAWGYRLGVHKGEYSEWCKERGIEPWAEWRPEMQDYCEGDTDTTRALVLAIRKAGVSAEAVETEHELAWYLAAQQKNGVPFNVEKAVALQAKLAAKREDLGVKLRAEFGWWYAPNGETVAKRPNKTRGIIAGARYTKLKIVEFSPTSRDHIANRLQTLYGWKPQEFTDGGKPKVDDDIIGALPYPCAPLLTEYLLVSKRLGQIAEGDEAWLRYATLDRRTGAHHIYGRINQTGCVTHRASHSKPNLGQVPKVTSPYGPECRELFEVPYAPRDPWMLLGTDASGLELRCLAHYMARFDDGAYGRTVTEGRNEDKTDIHSVNQRAAELPTRDNAKTFIYAYLYGAGDEKLGSIVAPLASPDEQRKIGAELRRKFERNVPALGYLVDDVKKKVKQNGYLKLIDGRRVYIRSEHSALNSLLQGTGAVICKRWIVENKRRFAEAFGPQGWNGKWAALLWVHDETQIAVRKSIAEDAARIDVASIEAMTGHFKFRVPLTGEAKLGTNWRETH